MQSTKAYSTPEGTIEIVVSTTTDGLAGVQTKLNLHLSDATMLAQQITKAVREGQWR